LQAFWPLTTLAFITGADNGFTETIFPVPAPPAVIERNRKTSALFFITPPANEFYYHLTQIKWDLSQQAVYLKTSAPVRYC
jgi:hypothetical protein